MYNHPVPLSQNLGALTSWNPLGLSRPVMGLLYLVCVRACVRVCACVVCVCVCVCVCVYIYILIYMYISHFFLLFSLEHIFLVCS